MTRFGSDSPQALKTTLQLPYLLHGEFAQQTRAQLWEGNDHPQAEVGCNDVIAPARVRRRMGEGGQHLFTNRPMWQRFEYDWLGNLSESDDDAHGFYDRSLGKQSHANTGKPYQLSSATNATHAASSGASGSTATLYDVTGNLRAMTVTRSTARLACLPSGSGCNQYYAYDYDEVGRLVRARRWDSATAYPAPTTSNLPSGDAQIELRYRYDASDQRVIKRVMAAEQRHTLYVFGSLEVRRTLFENDAYTISNTSLVPYAMANGVRLARLHYSDAASSPQVAGTGLGEQAYRTKTDATLHVLLELGDHLGSTGTVLDKLTSELVEKTTYLPFGARENDYRGTDEAGGSNRWSSFREDYGFTGKEEAAEVALTYFGKRVLSPQLGRWVTADPLAVHAPGEADFNLYAYVSGAVLKSVDPVGLDDEKSAVISPDTAPKAEGSLNEMGAQWGAQYQAADPSTRENIPLRATSDPREILSAWENAAKAAEGGKLLVNVGHGLSRENGKSVWGFDLAPVNKDGSPSLRIMEDD